MKAWAIIAAAGAGSRMNLHVAKQFLEWRGRPLYWRSAIAFSRSGRVDGLVFVFPADKAREEEERLKRLAASGEVGVPWKVAIGGARRKDSVKNGLAKTPANCDLVYIHDAARPFLTPELINRVGDALTPDLDGVVPGLKLADTVKVVSPANLVLRTPPREELRAIQTPQLFRRAQLLLAHETDEDATDDAALMETLGFKIGVCDGDPNNLKITNPEDARLLREKEDWSPRSGFGYDVHKYGGERPLKLGGVLIPGDYTVAAHSDGDVLLHALIDAILGCLGEGDIGDLFPDTVPAFENVSSAILLDETLDLARDAGLVIEHVDLTIVAQKPKIAAHKREIGRNVARLLGLEPARVSVKATTEEGLGFTGRVEGIKCCALATGRIRGN